MTDHLKIALLFALEREARPWAKASHARWLAKSGRWSLRVAETELAEVAAGVTGPGEKLGREGASWVFEQWLPDVALVCGLAGALRPDLCLGDIVLGERVVGRRGATSHQAKSEFISLAERTGLHWRRTTGVTLERVAGAIEEKLALAKETGADWVDMESSAVLAEAAERGIPAIAVRAVSDGLRPALTLDLNRAFDPERGWIPSKILLQLARRPWRLPVLVLLERRSHYAAGRLAKFLARYLRCLGECRLFASGSEQDLMAEVT